METQTIPLPLALAAGFLSFVSPCVLPLVPVYLGYLTGSTIGAESAPKRGAVFMHALVFVLGFTLIFVIAFGLPVGFLGRFMLGFTPILVKVGGIFLIIFGLHTTGLIKIPFLYMERRLEIGRHQEPGYLRSAFIGMTFAAGWTPCVGPLLGAILTLALEAQHLGRAILLLFAYSIGLGVPFLIIALLWTTLTGPLQKLNRHLNIVSVISGVFLIAIGFTLVTDTFRVLNTLFNQWTPAWLIEIL